MLKKRLIPKLMFKVKEINQQKYPVIVTTKNFNNTKFVGDPISQAKIFESQLTDELFLINMDSLDLDENTLPPHLPHSLWLQQKGLLFFHYSEDQTNRP